MKTDLVTALKNPHDSRRYGLLLPIREWLPGLNEENLLSLLGKTIDKENILIILFLLIWFPDTTSPAKLIRYAVNLGLDCELALYLLNGSWFGWMLWIFLDL